MITDTKWIEEFKAEWLKVTSELNKPTDIECYAVTSSGRNFSFEELKRRKQRLTFNNIGIGDKVINYKEDFAEQELVTNIKVEVADIKLYNESTLIGSLDDVIKVK